MNTKPKPFRNSVRDLVQLFPVVLRDAWIILFAIHLGRSISGELFSYAAQAIQARGREDLASLSLTISLQFVFEMAWSSVWSFIAIRVTRSKFDASADVTRSIKKDFEFLVIEGIRVMGAILVRVPLLIIPALVEIVRLSFVPHVVLLDRGYNKGEVDALKRSREIVRGRFILLTMTWLFYMAVSSAPSFLHGSMSQWFWERPVPFALETIVTLFINLSFEIFLVALFLRFSETSPSSLENRNVHADL